MYIYEYKYIFMYAFYTAEICIYVCHIAIKYSLGLSSMVICNGESDFLMPLVEDLKLVSKFNIQSTM